MGIIIVPIAPRIIAFLGPIIARLSPTLHTTIIPIAVRAITIVLINQRPTIEQIYALLMTTRVIRVIITPQILNIEMKTIDIVPMLIITVMILGIYITTIFDTRNQILWFKKYIKIHRINA